MAMANLTVNLTLLDREAAVPFTGAEHLTVEDILVECSRREILKIFPVSLQLFQFKQDTRWLAPDTLLGKLYNDQQAGANPPVLRIRFKIPVSRSSGGTTCLRHVDPVAFRYFYAQTRRDFESGKIYSRRQSGEKWLTQFLFSSVRDKKEQHPTSIELQSNIVDLCTRNMAIDIVDEKLDKKGIVSNMKSYIPRDLWTRFDKFMAVTMLRAKVEDSVDKLLKAFMGTTGADAQKEDYLRCTEIYFPTFMDEDFSAVLEQISPVVEEGKRRVEGKLLVTHPKESQEARLVVRRSERADDDNCITISQICNIALKDLSSGEIELSRMNGIPMYFCVLKNETISLLTLLCGYYRLIEKWTFSLCSEIRYLSLEHQLANKLHGPIKKDYARSKLEKLKFKKGSYIIYQSHDSHAKAFLMFCAEEGSPPEEMIILKDKSSGQYALQKGGRLKLADEMYCNFSTISSLVQTLKQNNQFKLTDCIHPSEFDRCPSLLLCRNPLQWKEDALGVRTNSTTDRFFILSHQLFKQQGVEHNGRMCVIWKGEWRKSDNEKVEVAIKQLKSEYMHTMFTEFLKLASRSMRYDNASICTVYGACLPVDTEPFILVREYFQYGPLDVFLQERSNEIKDVELLDAGTSLARALHFLQEKGMVHRELRCRNVYVAEYSDKTLKVKLCEGGLGGPRIEDVHWLDWHQLQGLVSSGALYSLQQSGGQFSNSSAYSHNGMASWNGNLTPTGMTGYEPAGGGVQSSHNIVCTLTSDVWSFGTLLWEIFSKGEKPLPDTALLDAARQYLNGDRLKWPMGQSLKQVEAIMINCWCPMPDQRIKPQTIMRDMNQILYRVFNSRRPNDYVTIGDSNLSTSTYGGSMSASMSTPPTPPLTSTMPSSTAGIRNPALDSGGSSADAGKLVPIFTDTTRNLFGGFYLPNFGDSDSMSPLIQTTDGSTSSIYNSDISALTCQTSIEWEGNYSINSIYNIENDQLQYREDIPLGEGNFGIVYRGIFTKENGEWEQVAVKKIKDTDMLTDSVYEDMEREIDLMKRLCHDNIVKIRGISNRGSNTIIVMEYIRWGSLDRYLQVNSKRLDYPRQLFNYCQNIVDGMEYLAQNKIVHRDLAARNILVYDEECVKISDFGLARDISSDYYVMQSTTNIPVKWLALECLLHSKCSHASDVWAFGVTIWEMFTFGQTPSLVGCENYFQDGASYDKHRQDLKNWIDQLQAGRRLKCTEFCPQNLYTRVMLNCWLQDPAARPTFTQLKHLLKLAELEST